MNLMDQFADPLKIESLSLTEKLAGSGITTVMGMGVTFIVLILLWGFIILFSKAIAGIGKQRDVENTSDNIGCALANKKHSSTCVNLSDLMPEGELVAVISAAAIAYSGKKTKGIAIRKIKRTAGDIWANAGRWENMR